MYVSAGGHDPPPCHTYIYMDNYTDQRLICVIVYVYIRVAGGWVMPVGHIGDDRYVVYEDC